MTIEEAIQHCIEQAEKMKKMNGCEECASEHEQLAEWLTELKQRRENEVNRAAILLLCNEIEDIVTELAELCEIIDSSTYRLLCDKLKAIGKELTGDA